MLPIYLCSLVAATVFGRKYLALAKLGLGNLQWVPEVLGLVARGEHQLAIDRCNQLNHPAGSVVTAMLRAHQNQSTMVREEALRVGNNALVQAESSLSLLAFLAQVAPLFGLLGTVIGMVDMFIGLQSAGTAAIDIGLLAGGIWKALLTTAAGLCVAVPTLAAHSYLASRADLLRAQLADIAQQLMNQLEQSEAV